MCHDQQINSTGVDRLHSKVMSSSQNWRCLERLLVSCACWVVISAVPGWPLTAAEEEPSGEQEPVVGETDQYDPGLEPLVMMARNDLAERLAVGVESIEVVEARLVVWPDASMGCPDPEMAYIQVPQDGSVIRLQNHSEIFQYHTGGDRMPFFCPEPAPGLGSHEENGSESDQGTR